MMFGSLTLSGTHARCTLAVKVTQLQAHLHLVSTRYPGRSQQRRDVWIVLRLGWWLL